MVAWSHMSIVILINYLIDIGSIRTMVTTVDKFLACVAISLLKVILFLHRFLVKDGRIEGLI